MAVVAAAVVDVVADQVAVAVAVAVVTADEPGSFHKTIRLSPTVIEVFG
jgi:hypothetical protein